MKINNFVDGPTGCFGDSKESLMYQAKAMPDLDFFASRISFADYATSSATFCISVFDACNLDCSYCFNREKKNSAVNMDEVFSFLESCFKIFPNKEKYYVDLSGKGEPLLYLDKILKIKEYCVRKQNELNVEVLVQFVCNGTMLNIGVANVLQSHGILFGVSIDGNREIHDLQRRTKTGEPTFDTIVSNVKAIPHHEYVGAAATLTSSTYSLSDSLKKLGEVFNTVSYKPSRNCDQAINQNSINDWCARYDELSDFLLDSSVNGDIRYLKTIINGDDYFGKFIKRVFLGTKVVNRCDGGLSRLALDSNGAVYPCPSSFPFEELRLGTPYCLNTNKMSELFEKQLSNKECLSCDVRHLCGGECMVERLLSNGNNKFMCQYKRHLIHLSIEFYLTLRSANSVVFDKVKSFCKEVCRRSKRDDNLYRFLKDHPSLSFSEAKKLFDEQSKRY